MPFVQITWLPKACRTAAVRKEVAEAVIKVKETTASYQPHRTSLTTITSLITFPLRFVLSQAMASVKGADISPDNLVVRFGEGTS